MALSNLASLAGSAFFTIVDWAGSSVVENLVSTAYSYLLDHLLPVDSEAELKRLQTALPQIKAVMGIAEALKMKYPDAGQWVEQFRQALEASEDVLDELEYKKLEDMVKNKDEASGSASSSKKIKLITLNNNTLKRLKEAVTMLDRATDGVERLLRVATALGIHSSTSESWQEAGKVLGRETTSFLAEREVFGREVEKGKIISWLKRPTHAHLSSLGIVGVGGLGKTTLVQFAYQEMRGSNHFDKTIWICVSTNFNVEDITIKMLNELGESSCCGESLNALHETLKEKIHSNKIFLVLDDVWEDEKRRGWEQLIAPLRFAQEGSKILFTTRMKSVADLLASVISSEHESLALQCLEEQELRLLFYSYAFYGSNPNNHRDLQIFGDEILKMLRGSPLAAKVIGSLLNSHMDPNHWRRILNGNSIFNLEQANDLVEVLKLSYYYLPANLQVCFRFCSIFPQDHKFDKDDLIKMWMAVGIIPQQLCQGKRPEDIGQVYFNHLLRKSFFEYDELWEVEERYVMHDLVHELAQNVSYGECCRIESNENSITIPNTVRHVYVHDSEIEKVFHLENLRSLVITTKKYLFILPNNLIKKSLRLLKISGDCALHEEIRCLVHLRYLSIGCYYVSRSLEDSNLALFYNLYHLRVLELSLYDYSDYSGIITTGMTNLIKLRYMRLPENIVQTIYGIHKLTSLQELTFFVGKESGHRINELGTLNNLRCLSINKIENIEDHVEAKSASLLQKNNLMSLSLKWTSESNPYNSEQIIDCLQFHPNLMELTIENYKGQRSPRWMEDSPPLYLSSLKLFNCPNWKNQLVSCQLPYLKILHIYNCASVTKLPDMPLSLVEFKIYNLGLTSLPYLYRNAGNNTPAPLSLKSLLRLVEIDRCPNLISLNGFMQQDNLDLEAIEILAIKLCEKLELVPIDAFGKLLSLGHLSIINCQNPTTCSSIPLSMIEFFIDNVGLNALPKYHQTSDSRYGPPTSLLKSSLRVVMIRNCQKLTAMNGFLLQDNIDFQSFEKIVIGDCRNLIHLPIGAFGKFASLLELIIYDCPMLVAVDNYQSNLLPMKLKSLEMSNCGEIDVPLLESASRLTNLTDLLIENCEKISLIPSSGNAFTSLNTLRIYRCKKLLEHSSREPVNGINQGSNLVCLKLSNLNIDHLSLLLIEPLRSLRSVSYFSVGNCSGMEALPEQWLLQNSSTLKEIIISDASSLNSLPATMARLTVLERLKIHKLDLRVEIPELPATLKEEYFN